MSKRPSVFDLDSMIVKKPAPQAVVAGTQSMESETIDQTPVAPKSAPAAPRGPVPPVASKMFRTSVYFSRVVHDKLRDIAHEERKSVTDLINEGLDHVLTSRNYPPTAMLREKSK